MSYGFSNPCYGCPKIETGCTDRKEIEKALQEIHSHTYDQGHQGYGNVELKCSAKPVIS